MPDRLKIEGLRAVGFHGVLQSEREDGQTFFVDAVLEIDSRAAATSDDLTYTADYGRISQELAAIVRGEPVNLIETLADRLAAVCLTHKTVDAVEITVHKPDAPISVPFDNVSITIRRERTPEAR